MIFTETPLPGAFVIDPERRTDERGFLARTWCEREFADRGLHPHWVQSTVTFNPQPGTLRGLHYQLPPHAEAKLIRCTRGAIYDVVVDMRPDSVSFRQWSAAELTADNGRLLFVPAGLAHGCLTLTADTEISYLLSAFYAPEAARGVRWDDPAFGIAWPAEVRVISERDRTFPDFTP